MPVTLARAGIADVVDAAPGGGHAADALVEVEVGAEGRDVHQEVVVEVVHADADDFRALVGDGRR